MRVTVDRIVSIEPDGETETYDLVMHEPYHNFVANGFIVHNSEQVSQRYVEVKPEHFAVPPLEGEAREIYIAACRRLTEVYQQLIQLIEPTVQWEYRRIFPQRAFEEKRWASAIKKRAQEVARYILPVATHAHLYHTVSAITLLRYNRLCELYDTPLEQRIVVRKMMEQVRALDPDITRIVEDPLPIEETPEYQLFHSLQNGSRTDYTRAFIKEFDDSLQGHISKLVDYKARGEENMAQAVRSVLGLPKSAMTDEEAIDLVLNPAKNPYFAEALNVTTHGKLTRAMVHPHFTFRKKLSHTADSQDQRHRMTPASRPILHGHFSPGRVDAIAPLVIEQTPAAKEFFWDTMEKTWDGIRKLLDRGVSEEHALYLLPNAFPIRFEESGDLLSFHHKWTHRLCYTAQEEIWKNCWEEVQQVKKVHPLIAEHLGAPCSMRIKAGIKPYCPEGDRFCGVPVWGLAVKDYKRVI